MKWFFLIVWGALSIFFYPSFDGAVVLMFLSLLFALRKDFLFGSFLLSLILDFFVGRIFGFHLILLSIFLVCGSFLLKKNLFFRKFAFLFLPPLYGIPYIGASRFFLPSFVWEEALMWVFVQTLLSVFAFFLVSYSQHSQNSKLQMPRHLRYPPHS